MDTDSKILTFDKTQSDYNEQNTQKVIDEFIKGKNIFKMREFEDDKTLCVAIIWYIN